jgi:hypothetical protein
MKALVRPISANNHRDTGMLRSATNQVKTAVGTAEGPGRAWVAAVFVVTLVVYGLSIPRVLAYTEPPIGDQPHYLLTTISLVEDHDIDELNNYNDSASYNRIYAADDSLDFRGISVPYPLRAGNHVVSKPTESGEAWYSKHGLGLPLLIAPGWVLGQTLTPILHGLTTNGGGGWPGTVFEVGLLGALLAVQVYLLAWDITHRRLVALIVWAALSFSNPLMTHSMLIFPEIPSALLTIYAFRRLRLGWPHNAWWQLVLVGLCVGYLPWLQSRFLPMVVGLLLFTIHQFRTWQSTATDLPRGGGTLAVRLLRRVAPVANVVTPVVVSTVLLGLYYLELSGRPLPNTESYEGFFVPALDAHGHPTIGDWPAVLAAAVGLLVDQQWGLLIYAPVYLLTFAGAVALWRAPAMRTTLVGLAVITLPYFFLLADFRVWWGGWSPPARYFTPIAPLLAAPLAQSLVVLWQSKSYRLIFGALAAFGMLMMALLLISTGDHAGGLPIVFLDPPGDRAPLFVWTASRLGLDPSPLLPAIAWWHTTQRSDFPWAQIIVSIGMTGAMLLYVLRLLPATVTSEPARMPIPTPPGVPRGLGAVSANTSSIPTAPYAVGSASTFRRLTADRRLRLLTLSVVGCVGLFLIWLLRVEGGLMVPMMEPSSPGALRPSTVIVSNVRLSDVQREAGGYRLEAVLSGASSPGPADVILRLRDKQSGEIVQTRRQINLDPGAALTIVIEMQAPRGEYTPEVEVQYPPR